MNKKVFAVVLVVLIIGMIIFYENKRTCDDDTRMSLCYDSALINYDNGKYIVQLGKGGKTWVHEIIVLNDSSFVMNLVFRPKDEVRIGVPRKLMYVTKNHKLKWKIIEAPKKN